MDWARRRRWATLVTGFLVLGGAFAMPRTSAAMEAREPPRADADAAVLTQASRGIVIRLRAAAVGGALTARAAGSTGLPLRLAHRLAVLGVRAQSFITGIPAAAQAHVSASASVAGASNPFELDPAAVWRLDAPDTAAAAGLLASLASDPDVAWAEPVVTRDAAGLPPGFPNDPLFVQGRQWGLDNRGVTGGIAGADVRARDAWTRTCGAPDLMLAVADTGIDPDHPEFAPDGGGAPRVIDGWNATDDAGPWADSTGHGTIVAGVFAAASGDGAHFDSLGMAGLCGGDGAHAGCRIVPIKITPGHATTATSYDLARAVVYAVAGGARAVHVSFAGAGASRVEREALAYAMARRCLVVAAAGNRGATAPTQPQYPAAYAVDGLCLQVGASDANDRRAVFSSYGRGLDLLAPGVDIWSTVPTYVTAGGLVFPGYVMDSGTSLAAPFGTGAAGLLCAARPELAADDVRELLRRTARDVGPPGFDAETGTGVLDAAAALAALAPDAGVWHDEVEPDSWTVTATDTLTEAESGPGAMGDPPWAWPGARRIEGRATVALPDSFADSVTVWPRVGGTMAVRGDFTLRYFAPFAEVVARGPRSFTLRGYVFEATDAAGDTIGIPVPRDQMRFGFTVVGRVRRGPLAAAPGPPIVRLEAAPNPFRTHLTIAAPEESTIEVFGIDGRRVRRWCATTGRITWDGRDANGHRTRPGLYWLTAHHAGHTATQRVIRLE